MHSDALPQVGEAAQLGAADPGLAGPGGLEKTTLPLVLKLALSPPFWGREPSPWGDLENGVPEGLGEPCHSSGHAALPGVISMYLMSGGGKRSWLPVRCQARQLSSGGHTHLFFLRLILAPVRTPCRAAGPRGGSPGSAGRSPQPNASLCEDPVRADFCTDTKARGPTPVLAGSQGRGVTCGHV